MKEIQQRIIVTLLILVSCLGSAQQVKAQWVVDGHLDVYKTDEERLRAFDQSLRLLGKADPMADLRMALQKNDTRFVGYYGYGLAAPGVSNKQVRYMVTHVYRFKVLKGSGDVQTPNISDRLQKVIQKYMKPYNRDLLKYIVAKKRNRGK